MLFETQVIDLGLRISDFKSGGFVPIICNRKSEIASFLLFGSQQQSYVSIGSRTIG